MTAVDQGPVVRQAIAERLEHATDEEVVFDCGFGYLPDDCAGGRLVLGYAVVFKTRSPVPWMPVLVHEARMIGHTPGDDQVDEMVAAAVTALQEQAARHLTL